MRRVLLVSATARRGGAERSLAALARRLPASGWQPHVALLERGPLEGWLAGTAVMHVEAVELADVIAPFDVVLANKWRGQLVAGPAAARAGRPCIWWQQDFPSASPPRLLDGSVPAAVAVCASEAVLSAQQRAAPWLPAVRIPLGIDVEEVTAARGSGDRIRAALGAPLVGTLGRLAPDKGQDRFLRGAARVARASPEAHFAVIGGDILGTNGGYAATLPELARRLGIASRVTFAGDRPDAYAWLDALDVLVHPAESEPFGLVLLEALTLGTRVVAVGAAGPAEVLAGDPRAVLVLGGRDADLAAGIQAALGEPPIEAETTAFSAQRMAAAFAELFEKVTAR